MPDDESTRESKPTRIRVRGADGEWRDLEAPPRKTGDADLDRIWSMPFGDFESILADTVHPLHKKAMQVSNEVTKPITEALGELNGRTFSSLKIGRDFSAISPGRDFSAVTKALDITSLLPTLHVPVWFGNLVPVVPGLGFESLRSFIPSAVDFEDVAAADVSVAEVAEASEVTASEIHDRHVEILSALLDQAQADSKSNADALNVARRSKSAAWLGAWAAIAAALISIVGIVVTMAVR